MPKYLVTATRMEIVEAEIEAVNAEDAAEAAELLQHRHYEHVCYGDPIEIEEVKPI